MGIRLLGSLVLSGAPSLTELSGLSWDEDQQILYALSDQGHLVHLRPIFKQGVLIDMEWLASHPLLNHRGKPLKHKWADSEGLDLYNGDNNIQGDSELVVSFERHHRIEIYTPDGQWIRSEQLPDALKKPTGFVAENLGPEAVTHHQDLGLITAPERLHRSNPNIPIYSQSGESWFYPVSKRQGSIVALEVLTSNEILIMERAYTSAISPWTITLSRSPLPQNSLKSNLTPKIIAQFNSTEGWMIQNMEGLTHHQGRRFFMVSDDGDKLLLQTQLLYFELLE